MPSKNRATCSRRRGVHCYRLVRLTLSGNSCFVSRRRNLGYVRDGEVAAWRHGSHDFGDIRVRVAGVRYRAAERVRAGSCFGGNLLEEEQGSGRRQCRTAELVHDL